MTRHDDAVMFLALKHAGEIHEAIGGELKERIKPETCRKYLREGFPLRYKANLGEVAKAVRSTLEPRLKECKELHGDVGSAIEKLVRTKAAGSARPPNDGPREAELRFYPNVTHTVCPENQFRGRFRELLLAEPTTPAPSVSPPERHTCVDVLAWEGDRLSALSIGLLNEMADADDAPKMLVRILLRDLNGVGTLRRRLAKQKALAGKLSSEFRLYKDPSTMPPLHGVHVYKEVSGRIESQSDAVFLGLTTPTEFLLSYLEFSGTSLAAINGQSCFRSWFDHLWEIARTTPGVK